MEGGNSVSFVILLQSATRPQGKRESTHVIEYVCLRWSRSSSARPEMTDWRARSGVGALSAAAAVCEEYESILIRSRPPEVRERSGDNAPQQQRASKAKPMQANLLRLRGLARGGGGLEGQRRRVSS